MNWGRRRQVLIAFGAVCVLVLVAALGWYAFLYAPPTCSDGVRNQDEGGVDCGGVCTRMCEVSSIDVQWSRAVRVVPGIYHAVALVTNPRVDARGTDVEYTFTLYDAEGTRLTDRSGTVTLGPGEQVPIFEPSLQTGARVPTRTFIEVRGGTWDRAEASADPLSVASQEPLASTSQSIAAVIENVSSRTVPGFIATVLVYDTDGILLTASQSRSGPLDARAQKSVVFTWPEPFARPPARADVTVRVAP